MLTEFRSVRSVHVLGHTVEASQPTVAPTLVSPPHNPPAQESSHQRVPSLNFTGESPYSSPSPSIYPQERTNSALSLAELPNDTPFNFDFSNLHPSLGSNMLFQQQDTSHSGSGHQTPAFNDQTDSVFGTDFGFGPGVGSGMSEGASAAWNQAPIAYG